MVKTTVGNRCHCSELQTNLLPLSQPQPPLSQLIPAGAPRAIETTSSASGCGGSIGVSEAQNPIAHHILPWEWCPETEVT